MDPYQNQRNQLNSRINPVLGPRTSDVSGNDQTPENPGRKPAAGGDPQPADRQPRYSDGFTVIPPNQSRRSQMQTIAQREEENLERWRETNRVTSVHVNPEKLGGGVTLAEAREKQFTNLRCSKLQKKLKQEELEKRRKQEEEEKLQRMRAEQRQKAERLEERRRQEEQRRREQLWEDHLRTTDSFLQNLASSSAPQTSSRTEAAHGEQRNRPERSEGDVELDRRRVNAAFLDKLEGRGGGSGNDAKVGGARESEGPGSASDGLTRRPSAATEQQVHRGHAKPDPERSSGCTEEADLKPDFNWALTKLIDSFPGYKTDFLEDILTQCNGDYEQAYMLLIC